MPFNTKSISVSYQKKQDRLAIVFIDYAGQQASGVLTRSFLKNLLLKLPSWLSESDNNQSQQAVSQLASFVEKDTIEVNRERVVFDRTVEVFLVQTVNLAMNSSKQIRMTFTGEGKTDEVLMVCTHIQFHKLISEILLKVQGWDLDNLWKSKQFGNDLINDEATCLVH